ncbi:surfeit locus protein 6 [Bufo gargarizans]|uniref:surfeit locus protein 6 n=1 Tax=Bufo gargarizans TaxID=30331 RepID=UPI001CF3093C|nr:surfeit locus protein 6 [Bufo gargarizans]XP_044129246.1 surfeit locus protein 6 [Bufo gargarizans]XP_044129247.1 surfeit locus protein 6 [Bufo gargarizans]
MASLVSKDSYLQSLGKKVCAQPSKGTPKRRADEVFRSRNPEEPHGPKKKKKLRKLRPERGMQGRAHRPPVMVSVPHRTEPALSSFSTVDLLRKCLHEKIEESRGQVSNKTLSTEEINKKRQRRKQERERKKRKRKELKMETQQTPQAETSSGEKSTEDLTKDSTQPPLVFNKVEVHDEPLNKVMKKKEKKQSVKGKITPMTGKNYKQLLSRLEARKGKLEELRAKDQEKAKEFEDKIKWTNVLYKAEGLKIKDDEGMLKTALKRKEKQKEQRKKLWDKRTQNTAEKMQQRQDKRSRNIKKKKVAKLEKKKNRARKRGRIMPEDLAKASVK